MERSESDKGFSAISGLLLKAAILIGLVLLLVISVTMWINSIQRHARGTSGVTMLFGEIVYIRTNQGSYQGTIQKGEVLALAYAADSMNADLNLVMEFAKPETIETLNKLSSSEFKFVVYKGNPSYWLVFSTSPFEFVTKGYLRR